MKVSEYTMQTFLLSEKDEMTKDIITTIRSNNDRNTDRCLAKLIAACALATGTLGVLMEDMEDDGSRKMAEECIYVMQNEVAEGVKEAHYDNSD